MAGLALVDYANLCGPRVRPPPDRDTRTERLVEAIVGGFHRLFSEVDNLEVRLYGGWTDEEGLPSPAAEEAASVLAALPGDIAGVRVRFRMATAMLPFPEAVLYGTVRLGARPPRQKMVDGMLGGDAVFAARSGFARVCVVTDDEDLVPAMLTARALSSNGPFWLRRRVPGSGLNDAVLWERGVRIERLRQQRDERP